MLKVIAVCQVYNMMVLYLISTPRKGSSRGREVRTISIFFYFAPFMKQASTPASLCPIRATEIPAMPDPSDSVSTVSFCFYIMYATLISSQTFLTLSNRQLACEMVAFVVPSSSRACTRAHTTHTEKHIHTHTHTHTHRHTHTHTHTYAHCLCLCL